MKLKSIPKEELPKMIGKGIHLSWAKPGCIWILDSINGEMLKLHTPMTGKRVEAEAKDALYTRKNEPRD
jgi:hypothetical protein